MRRTRSQTISIASDDRARIPFAIIGVLLLVSSIMIVAILETRDEPEIDTSTERAIDRGEAYATSEIRHATIRASDDVVQSPLTTVDSDLEDVIDEENAFEDQTKLTILAEATASLEGRHQDVGQGQTVSISLPAVDDWTDETDLEGALEAVDIEAEDGIMDVTINDVEITVRDEDGNVAAEHSRDITVSVGTTMMELHEHVEDYEEHLNKGMIESIDDREGYGYDLAKRMWPLTWGKAYYDRLLGDPADRAFENVTPNDHTEVMANDARFTAQQEAFGTQDDYANRVMAGPQLCMAYDLSEDALDLDYNFDNIAAQLHPDEDVDTVDALCEEGIVSPDGELPDMPTIEELIVGMLEGVDMEGEIQGHVFADMAMHEMEADLNEGDLESEMREPLNDTSTFTEAYLEDYYGNSERSENIDEDDHDDESIANIGNIQNDLESIRETSIEEVDNTENVVESIYSIDTGIGEGYNSPSRDGPAYPPTPTLNPDEYDIDNLSEMDPTYTSSVEDVGANINEVGSDNGDSSLERSLVDVDINVEMRYGTTGRWNDTNTNSSPDVTRSDFTTTNYTTSFELDGEIAPDIEITPHSVEHVLDSGGTPDPYVGGSPTNWEGASEAVTEEYFGQRIDSDAELEEWVESRSDTIESVDDFEDAINFERGFDEEVQLSPRSADELQTEIVHDDLMDVHLEVVQEIEPVKADIMEMLTAEESPMREIEENIEEVERQYVTETDDFENAPDVATMEARQVYFNSMYDYVDELATHHEQISTGGGNLIDDLLGGMLDSANDLIGGPMDLLDEMLGSGEELLQDEGGSEVDTPDVLNDVHIDVDGSPTYHSSQTTVNQTEVPAVREEGDGPLDIDENAEFAPMGAAYENQVGFPGFPLIPWPPLFYLQVDAWEVELEGEYTRFEVQATSGDPSSTGTTTYVREDKDVSLETPSGSELELGSSDAISYENSQTIMAVVPAPQFMPQGAPGVGDNEYGEAPGEACSEFWNDVGADAKTNSGENCF
ncbi:hypothetical protein SAMN04487967_2045 [Natronorubrum sediminis]|uniref:Uncharacterized protein n=2 Tax=Natronorubrum sediminis TaxID=640943 RepID=A0A1H6FY91_9EURY|nr:hypothetical protein SAMN04487967_2045 [Natronorubrum sediminis]